MRTRLGKDFDFHGKRNIFFAVSIGLIVIGLFFNIFFGTQLSVAFKGGTIAKFEFTGELDKSELEKFAHSQTGENATVSMSTSDGTFSLTFATDLPTEETSALYDALEETYRDNGVKRLETSKVTASMGKMFLLKCGVAIVLSSLLLLVYVAFRFRKIGGWSAGAMALVALLHDIAIAYFTFVVLKIPLNDNFVAVVLVILGYSLNDTIIIYDRIRENRRQMDKKTPLSDVVNLSINQSFSRSVATGFSTFLAIGMVALLALIFNIESIISFAVPMMIGVIAGAYSSIFLCCPLWVMWMNHKDKRGTRKQTPAKGKGKA